MQLSELMTSTVNLVVGADGAGGILGADFGVFLAVGLVASLAVTQLPRLAKRLR